MNPIPTLLGTVQCALLLSSLLLATAVGSKTSLLRQAVAQTEVTLPAPTGPHKTGHKSFH